jgi:acyl carrier protein
MNKNKIIELISDGLEMEVINDKAMIDSVQEYDSMGILMIMEIFEQNGVDLFPEDFANITIVSDLVDMIHSKQ